MHLSRADPAALATVCVPSQARASCLPPACVLVPLANPAALATVCVPSQCVVVSFELGT